MIFDSEGDSRETVGVKGGGADCMLAIHKVSRLAYSNVKKIWRDARPRSPFGTSAFLPFFTAEIFQVCRCERSEESAFLWGGEKQQIPHRLKPVRNDKRWREVGYGRAAELRSAWTGETPVSTPPKPIFTHRHTKPPTPACPDLQPAESPEPISEQLPSTAWNLNFPASRGKFYASRLCRGSTSRMG
jgi:hypothetical protein